LKLSFQNWIKPSALTRNRATLKFTDRWTETITAMRSDTPQCARVNDWIIAFGGLALLAMLVLPAVAQSRGDSRADACLERCKFLSAGLMAHEDSQGFFPPASTAPFDGHPCNDSDDGDAGYSWHTRILPWLDEGTLSTAISDQSAKYLRPPLAVRLPEHAGGKLACAIQLEQFRCPAFSGPSIVDVTATDYKSADSGTPALTNYFALSSTHLIEQNGLWRLAPTPLLRPHERASVTGAPAIEGNGVLPFFSRNAMERFGVTKWRALRGISQAAIRDGTSNTFVFVESRELGYAAWIDGQVAWVVAAWPQNPNPPRLLPELPRGQEIAEGQWQVLGWPEDEREFNRVAMAPQNQDVADEKATVYLPEAMWSGTKDRKLGPSGNHLGVTMHAFADGHCRGIAESIDATVYLHLTTRAGGEIVDDAAFSP
jgi:hypothetical protein